MAYGEYIFRRSNGIFYFRLILTNTDKASKEIRFSLRTRKRQEARCLAAICCSQILPILRSHQSQSGHAIPIHLLAQEVQQTLTRVRASISNENNASQHHPAPPYHPPHYHSRLLLHTPPAVDQTNSYPLSKVIELFKAEMLAGGNWQPKTLEENMASYQLFQSLLGLDLPISSINRQHLTQYKDQLKRVPTNYKKMPSIRGHNLRSVIETAHGLNTLSITSVNKHLTKISSLFKWAKLNGYCPANVAESLNIKSKVKEQDKRLPFKNNELRQLFSTPIHRAGKFQHTYYYWLPLIALYSGARINEICQLDVADIKCSKGIYFFDINGDGDKRLKSPNSQRHIPIHEKLIALGLLAFHTSCKQSSYKKLFPSIKAGRDGHGQGPSKWFGRLKQGLTLEHADKKSFHSLRHNFSDGLLNAGVEEAITAKLMGHTHPNITHGVYGKGASLAVLRHRINQLSFDIPEISILSWENGVH